MRVTILVISTLVATGCSFDTKAISGFSRLDAGVYDVGTPDRLPVSDGGHEPAVQSDAMPDTLVQQDAKLGDTAVQMDSSQTDTLVADGSSDTAPKQDAGQSDTQVATDSQPDVTPPQSDASQSDSQVAQEDASQTDAPPPPPCTGLVAVYTDPASISDCFGVRSNGGVVGLGKNPRVGPFSDICQIGCKNSTGYLLPSSCEVQYPTPQIVGGCAHLDTSASLLAGVAGCDYMARCAS